MEVLLAIGIWLSRTIGPMCANFTCWKIWNTVKPGSFSTQLWNKDLSVTFMDWDGETVCNRNMTLKNNLANARKSNLYFVKLPGKFETLGKQSPFFFWNNGKIKMFSVTWDERLSSKLKIWLSRIIFLEWFFKRKFCRMRETISAIEKWHSRMIFHCYLFITHFIYHVL